MIKQADVVLAMFLLGDAFSPEWSSVTLAENVALPLQTYTDLSPSQTREVVSLKLALVGLAGFEEFSPDPW